MDEYGRVYAKLLGEKGIPAIGLNSHVDTALEVSGKNVKPRVIEKYDGGVIKLNDTYSMSPNDFPRLATYLGQSLVVTDGNTLLGGDDKAGLAIIMHIVKTPKIRNIILIHKEARMRRSEFLSSSSPAKYKAERTAIRISEKTEQPKAAQRNPRAWSAS